MEALAYFRQLQGRCASVLARLAEATERADVLCGQLLAVACDTFEANVAHQSHGHAPIDCSRGCATCCTLRVTATAPEVLWLAAFIRAVTPALKARGIDLRGQVQQAHLRTHGLGERGRLEARQRCPFIAQGVCVVYQVRPLACRGLASHDRRACANAAAGRIDRIPYSEPHLRVRGLVQNAMQSALRDAGVAWLAYELNAALLIALDDPHAAQRWARGEDVFVAAQVNEVPVSEMAATFDQIKAMLPS